MFAVQGLYQKAVAVHEAGHTVVGTHLDYGTFLGVAIAEFVRPGSGQPAGGAAFDLPSVAFRTKQTYLDQVCTLLAGLAAEQVVLGSGATALATLMEAQFGFGENLRHILADDSKDWEKARRSDPVLRAKIEAILGEQFQRAVEILERRRPLLDALADVLVEKGGASPDEVSQMLAEFERRDEIDQSAA